MTTSPHLLNSAEACEALGGIDRSTLSRWVSSGKIVPFTKLPGVRGAYLFTPEEIARAKAAATATTSGDAA